MVGVEHKPVASSRIHDERSKAAKYVQDDPPDSYRSGHLIGSILVAVLAEGNRMLFPDGQVNADRRPFDGQAAATEQDAALPRCPDEDRMNRSAPKPAVFQAPAFCRSRIRRVRDSGVLTVWFGTTSLQRR